MILVGERTGTGADETAEESDVRSVNQGSGYTVAAVDRAITILKAFRKNEPEINLAEVVARTGLHKATAFRLLATLCQGGLVFKSRTSGNYGLGFEVLALAEVAKSRTSLVAHALPVMRRIRDAVRETTFLCIRTGDYRIDIEQIEGPNEYRRVLDIGVRRPLHVGAASKVLLASLPDEQIESYLKRTELKPLSRRTIVDPGKLRSEIRRIRARGYAESRNERGDGGVGAAAPIFDGASNIVGAICVSAPIQNINSELQKRIIEVITAGSADISRTLAGVSSEWSGHGNY